VAERKKKVPGTSSGSEGSGAGRSEGSGAGDFSAARSTSKPPAPSPSPAPSNPPAPTPSRTGPSPSRSPDSSTSAADSPPNGREEERVERDLSDLLTDVERERDEYLELARRTKADFDNYRRRVAGEAAQAEKRGRAELARGLIPVLDNLERALEHRADRPQADDRVSGGTSDASFVEGVRLVLEELVSVLKRSGIESFEPAGEPFDPHQHEAMMMRPGGSDDAGKVLEVLEKGYQLDGQVLRPARVVVGANGREK
jgi:molecular chaperone GrpE